TVASYDPAAGLGGEPTETREAEPGGGSGIPFLDYMDWPFARMLAQAGAAGPASETLALVTGRRPLPFVIARAGDNAYTARHPTRGVMDIEVDGQGRLISLDAGKTTRALRVTRQRTVV